MPDEAVAESPLLTDAEVQALSVARDHQLQLEQFEHAYDASVRSIRSSRLVLSFATIALAIGFLYTRYLVAKNQDVHEVVAYVSIGVALLVVVMIIWSYMARWDGQMEKKHEIASAIQRLVARYEKARARRPVDLGELEACFEARVDIDAERKHGLATLPRRFICAGHQHVAMTYRDDPIECSVCRRAWQPSFAKRRRWVRFVPFMGCEGCGV